MHNPFRFFKCNIINGCRLADIERFVVRDEVFYLNAHIACTWRSVNAAINASWIIEISEKEASKHISIPVISDHIEKPIEISEDKTIHSADMQVNKAAFDRYQERLKKLEKTKTPNEEKIETTLQIEPGKNENENIGALQRIKNRNKKIKTINNQEKDFIDDIVSVERDGHKKTVEISKQLVENRTTPKTEQIVKKSKTELKQELEEKLEKKLLEKKTIKNDKTEVVKEIKKRGRPKKTITLVEDISDKKFEKKRMGRPKGSKNKLVVA